ncbi:FMN adenylyltransferase /riboflavin kinase [Marininema mesophilum]|uniref:Riboflavin biosynthesis protein n=1 Tax=Marininema mesophilum TaxID=1048340 RepID=A0A1H2SM65_9BACL|nr:bifunctional riboflavin kinase/FAD synthetase [Marininema mesophilum]SDW32716.1 FMN adenylyltransferase /riboflavin kinase [Marininema mesophilum]
METIHITYPLREELPSGPVALAIGYFDGVHRGHQAVIESARRLAESTGAKTGIMIFHPHPREVLGKGTMSHYLTPLPEKLRQFAKLGVDRTYVVRFDKDFARLSKESFVKEVLLPLEVSGMACGFNFSFGQGAEGKAEDLKQLGEGYFEVMITTPIDLEGSPVSSTRLRGLLAAGQVEEAAQILGRPFSLRGRVGEGDRRGRTIGYPTANLILEEPYTVPLEGVYAVTVNWGDEERAKGMMNIGHRPTFNDPIPRRTLEVHLFDRDEDLYGQELTVHFYHRLRKEKRFQSVDELIAQLKKDEQDARRFLQQKLS